MSEPTSLPWIFDAMRSIGVLIKALEEIRDKGGKYLFTGEGQVIEYDGTVCAHIARAALRDPEKGATNG